MVIFACSINRFQDVIKFFHRLFCHAIACAEALNGLFERYGKPPITLADAMKLTANRRQTDDSRQTDNSQPIGNSVTTVGY